MNPSRILVVYYSRTGITQAVAQAIRADLRCDIERLRDRPPSRLAALVGRSPVLMPLRSDLEDYELVVVGGPAANGVIAPPVRTFLEEHHQRLRRVAFFCTYAGSGSSKVFREMARHAGQHGVLSLDIRRHDAASHTTTVKVRTLGDRLRGLVDQGRISCGGPQAPPSRRDSGLRVVRPSHAIIERAG